MSDPFGHGAAQLGRAMRAMGLTGLIGRGGGSSAMAETIPARTSDYLPSVVGADMGLVVLLAVLGTLFLVCLTLVIAARTVTGMGGILATGMAMLLLVPAVWTGLGNLGLLPLSGVDVPFLTANGTSTLASSITLGAADDTTNEIGPLISQRQRDRVASFVNRARELNHVQITTGGEAMDQGFYYRPTCLLYTSPSPRD